MLEIINEVWLQSLIATVVVGGVLYQITRIVRIKINKNKIVPTHMLKITFTEPIKGERFYENNIKGLKLGFKIRKRNFKHEVREGLDVIEVIGSKEEIEQMAATRTTKKNEEYEETLKDKTGSTITEELIELEMERRRLF